MPSIMRRNVAAGIANDLDGLQFQDIPVPSLVTIYASTAVAGGNIDYSVGNTRYLVAAAVNIEGAIDVVDRTRDKVLDREPVPPGKQFLSVNAQVCNYDVVIEEVA